MSTAHLNDRTDGGTVGLASWALCAEAQAQGVPVLGLTPGPDPRPVPWTSDAPLALICHQFGAAAPMDGLVSVLAAQAHALDPGAVTLINGYIHPGDSADQWEPLARAGVDVHTLAAEPGRTVGALAALAAVVTHRTRAAVPATGRRWLIVDAWDCVESALTTRGEHGYAAAARSALRIIATHGPATGVRLVARMGGTTTSTPYLSEAFGAALHGTVMGEPGDTDRVRWTLHSNTVLGTRITVPPAPDAHVLERIAAWGSQLGAEGAAR